MTSASTSSTAHSRKIAIALAFTGALFNPIPLAWLHKFYLGQYFWGLVYLVLAPTRLPQIACCFEGIWYLTQSDESFIARFPRSNHFILSGPTASDNAVSDKVVFDKATSDKATHLPIDQTATQTATAIREIEQLRQEGLITEYEFEQKRRRLLDRV
ncbi:MAG: SHOCT domain-containing protein [Cyanobacteria bacterium P01_D01_bin.105]